MVVRIGLRALDFKNCSTSLPNLESWSNKTYRYGPGSGNASRSCCTIQSLVGWNVTLKCRTHRRACSMTKKQYKVRK